MNIRTHSPVSLFRTGSLSARPLEVRDLPAYNDLHRDPDVIKHFGEAPPLNNDSIPRLKDWNVLAVTNTADQFVGRCGIWDDEETVTVDLFFIPDFRGRGHASPFLKALCAFARSKRSGCPIGATVHTDNCDAKRVLARCGFSYVKPAKSLKSGVPQEYWLQDSA